jgi:tetrahydromethanopterin S-methyltransferase subunit G
MTDQLNQICQAIGRLEGKVDAINQRLDVANGRTNKLEDRTNNVETDLDQMKGKATIIGIVAGVVVSFITNLFFKKY